MPVFDYQFLVEAPLDEVRAFHDNTDALKRLTPPPMLVQLHQWGPMEEGMVARFTLWLGPIPIGWTARHEAVSPAGFTDVQIDGPLRSWRHRHRFVSLGPSTTQIEEHIEYTYFDGLRGLLNRLLFAPPALRMLFHYRKLVTRRALARPK